MRSGTRSRKSATLRTDANRCARPNADPAFVQTVHAFVRKSAHVTEYGILAALASRAVLSLSTGLLSRYWWLVAILLVAAVASLDEFNQSFNAARTSSPWDVLLDISGGTLAVFIISLFQRLSPSQNRLR